MQDNSLFCDTNLTDEQLAQKAKGACSDELSALFGARRLGAGGTYGAF
ncbi:MAG: hypothetical protein RSA00_02595 [Hydrogenoanaerobacterium sp.]